MVAGRGVADDRQVAVVGKGLGTLVDPAVFVQVGELDLSRARHLVGGLQERLRGVRVDVVLVAEKPFDPVAPDFAQLHAFVIIVEVTRGVDILGHPRTRVPYHGLDAVTELLAGEFETVAPPHREFPAVGLQRGVVPLGGRRSIYRGRLTPTVYMSVVLRRYQSNPIVKRFLRKSRSAPTS